MTGWFEGTSHKDWLIDGHTVKGDYYMRMWAHLDWSRAWCDMGPSPMGNLGPYWHVPVVMDGDEMVKRLYPRWGSKWHFVARRAIEEQVARANKERDMG